VIPTTTQMIGSLWFPIHFY